MFGGRDENALAHEAGGVADALDVFPTGGNWEIVQVGAAEYNTGTSGGWYHAKFYGYTRMKTDSAYLDRLLNSRFELH